MSITDPKELAGLRAAGAVVRRMLTAMRAAVRVGVTTGELDKVGAEVMRECGAQSAPQLVYKLPGVSGFSVIRDLGGHGIGRTIHEAPRVPNYPDPDAREILTEGLVITVEPIIAAGSGRSFLADDGWTVRTADRQPSAHYEHTLVI